MFAKLGLMKGVALNTGCVSSLVSVCHWFSSLKSKLVSSLLAKGIFFEEQFDSESVIRFDLFAV